jgi:hypothetical protein
MALLQPVWELEGARPCPATMILLRMAVPWGLCLGMAYVPMDFRNSKEDNYKISTLVTVKSFYQSCFHDQVQESFQAAEAEALICIDKS